MNTEILIFNMLKIDIEYTEIMNILQKFTIK